MKLLLILFLSLQKMHSRIYVSHSDHKRMSRIHKQITRIPKQLGEFSQAIYRGYWKSSNMM